MSEKRAEMDAKTINMILIEFSNEIGALETGTNEEKFNIVYNKLKNKYANDIKKTVCLDTIKEHYEKKTESVVKIIFSKSKPSITKKGSQQKKEDALLLINTAIDGIKNNMAEINKKCIEKNNGTNKNYAQEFITYINKCKESYEKGEISFKDVKDTMEAYRKAISDICGIDIMKKSSKITIDNKPSTRKKDEEPEKVNHYTKEDDKLYDDIVVTATNYIRLMKNNEANLLRSREAIEKGRNTKENEKRFSDILSQLEIILTKAKNKTESPRELNKQLNSKIEEIKREFNLDINMINSKNRKKVIAVNKIVYGLGGIVLGAWGINRVFNTVRVITGLGLAFVSPYAALMTGTLLAISGDLLTSALVTGKGKILIEKIIDNLLNEKSDKKGRGR